MLSTSRDSPVHLSHFHINNQPSVCSEAIMQLLNVCPTCISSLHTYQLISHESVDQLANFSAYQYRDLVLEAVVFALGSLEALPVLVLALPR